ncbi:hypothetical protein TWF281_009653 [Arthrobotrys megalospora]
MAPSRIPKPAASSNVGNVAKIRKEKVTTKTTLKARLLQRRQGIVPNDAPDSSFWDVEATEKSAPISQEQESKPKSRKEIVEASVWDLPIAQEEPVPTKGKSSSRIPIKKASPGPTYKPTVKPASKMANKSGQDDDYIPDESSQVMPKTKNAGKRKMPARKSKIPVPKPMVASSSPISSSASSVPASSPLCSSDIEVQDETLVHGPERLNLNHKSAEKAALVSMAQAAVKCLPKELNTPIKMSQSAVVKAVAVPHDAPVRHYSLPQSPADGSTAFQIFEDTTLIPDGNEAEPAE